MVTPHYEVRAQKIVPPALQCTQNDNKLVVGSIVILLCYGQPVQQVLHWQSGLPIITELYQSGANCIIQCINPDFMGLLLVKDLQYWSGHEGFLKGLKCSFFGSFPFELDCPGRFNGKLRVGNSREIPVSRETGGKSLSLRNSQVTGISRGLGNSCAMRNSHVLEVITFSPGNQIII